MSPYYYRGNTAARVMAYLYMFTVSGLDKPGYMDSSRVFDSYAVRPVISLDISKLIDDSIVE